MASTSRLFAARAQPAAMPRIGVLMGTDEALPTTKLGTRDEPLPEL
jgi:hypothetical protein